MKLSEDVLAALSGAEVSGNALKLTAQLDRKLYLKVNDALTALGGKWNRKAKAHLFEGDASDRIDEAVLSGTIERGADFGCFFTPLCLADRVAEEADLFSGARVLEPSAGHGELVRAMQRVHEDMQIECVEILERNVEYMKQVGFKNVCFTQADFLSLGWLGLPFDRVVMNPPFAKRQDIAHVLHAFSFLKQGGKLIAIMSAGVEFRSDKLATGFRDFVASNGSIERLPSGSFKSSGTNVETVLVKIGKSQ